MAATKFPQCAAIPGTSLRTRVRTGPIIRCREPLTLAEVLRRRWSIQLSLAASCQLRPFEIAAATAGIGISVFGLVRRSFSPSAGVNRISLCHKESNLPLADEGVRASSRGRRCLTNSLLISLDCVVVAVKFARAAGVE